MLNTHTLHKLLLTEKSSQGTPQMSITLENWFISTYQLVGDQSTASPTEQLSFTYERITIQNLVTGVSFCYDRIKRMKC
jgi:type VI protein secretion system component Hcp